MPAADLGSNARQSWRQQTTGHLRGNDVSGALLYPSKFSKAELPETEPIDWHMSTSQVEGEWKTLYAAVDVKFKLVPRPVRPLDGRDQADIFDKSSFEE